MDIDKLKAFYEVVDKGSFHHATNVLQLSESGVRRQISAIEKELSLKLFANINQRLVLTEQGKVFFECAKEMLYLYNKSLHKVLAQEERQQTICRLGMTTSMGSLYATDMAARLTKKVPETQWCFQCHDATPNFAAGAVDGALQRGRVKDMPSLEQKYVTTFQMGLYASEAYCAERGMPNSPEELKEHDLISYPENAFTPYHDINWHLHIDPTHHLQARIQVNSGMVILQAIESGLGIGSLSQKGTQLSKAPLVRILPEYKGTEIPVYFIYDPNFLQKNLAEQIHQTAKEVLAA